MPIEIRELGPEHVQPWRALRLRALATAPEAFGSSVEEAEATPLEELAMRFRPEAAVDRPIFGAFQDGELVGTGGLARETSRKSRHSAFLWGMFVAPEVRGQGVAARLVDAIVARGRAMPGLERITLAVVTTNEVARRLYERKGFVTYGVDPRVLKVGEAYLDEALMVLDLQGPAPVL